MYPEADFLPVSGMQHMIYCPRQCGLIHVDREWEENRFTAEGRVLHERVDKGGEQEKSGVRLCYAMPLKSLSLGLFGVADCVEFHKIEKEIWQPVPVEYKRGKPKLIEADRVQLCAQAICLEEMLHTEIREGFLFYASPRRRETVPFDAALRELTRQTAMEYHAMMESGVLPKARYRKDRCDRCSLFDICQPKAKSAKLWLQKRLSEDLT
ncbi:CRISPR-associated protein Cas4 [Desulfobotulus sp. H1]|uniref:CRISPR-associated exonuclease Cas4 n=1 Tax=Desulfobotulus pelophilus TaxID=2823377 RepID=A0ABT3NB07_9BACT|nr:CRISPR-associated protein Cas4 [Desulfobotulus pelophilus]MCW7754649.1 CRISPR-associated protein Cas4 [Desulfobotulus pelophilus]